MPFKKTKSTDSLRIQAALTKMSLAWCIEFRITGDLQHVKWPNPQQSYTKQNDLWKTTCFELFCKPSSQSTDYFEWNFSPSGNWGFFAFKNYRDPLTLYTRHSGGFLGSHMTQTDGVCVLTTYINTHFSSMLSLETLQFHFTAVVEHSNGELSYWALRHAPEKPDFHAPACFVLSAL